MKTLLTLSAALLLSGCATAFNDHEQSVEFRSDKPGMRYTVTNEAGRQVAGGVTPSSRILPAAAGYFDGERYTVQSGKKTQELDSSVNGWFWVDLLLFPISGCLLLDPITGDMYELQDVVNLGEGK
jgi:hypothetical protein